MGNGIKTQSKPSVDKSLVAMFIKMSPEERLCANDNAVRAILEMRHAYKQQQDTTPRPKRNH